MIAETTHILENLPTKIERSLVPDAPEIREETITPEQAKTMLRSIVPGKERDDKAVETYARAMRNDTWVVNGEAIKFDEKGRVLDGVQRLHACVEANKPFTTLVVRNVEAATLHTMDQHRRRTYSGVLEAMGFAHASALSVLIVKLMRIENGAFGTNLTASWDFYSRIRDANPLLQEAVMIAPKYGSYILNSSIINVVAFMALAGGHREELMDFLERIKDYDPEMPTGGLSGSNRAYGSNAPEIFASAMARWDKESRKVDKEGRPYREKPASAEKILGDMILFFNAFLTDKIVDSSLSWTPTKFRRHKNKETGEYEVELVPNMGLPKMIDYPGLAGGRLKVLSDASLQDGEISENEKLLQDSIKQREAAGEKVVAFYVNVTPAIAERWLQDDINRGNRGIQMRHVETIKRDILNDRWMLNAQAICFSSNPFDIDKDNPPRLLNGQHRLRAVLEAGRAVQIPIAINVDPEAFQTYDTHAKSSPVTADGTAHADTRVMTAAARFLWKKENNISPYESGGMTPSASELNETIQRHPRLAHFAALARTKNMRSFGSAGVLAYFFYSISNEDPEAAEIMINYMDLKEVDLSLLAQGSPLNSLVRELQIRPQSGSRGKSRKDVLMKLDNFWGSFRKWYHAQKDGKAENGKQPDLF